MLINRFTNELSFFYCILLTTISNSQNLLTTLSQKSNHYLSQDSYHHTWISSADGVNVFDGANVKVYKPGKYNLIGNNIQSHFFEDCNTNVWFSSFNALHVYVREKDAFLPFQFFDDHGKLVQTDYKVLAYKEQFVFFRYGPFLGIFDINVNKLVRRFDLKLNSYLNLDLKLFGNKIILTCYNGNEILLLRNDNYYLKEFKELANLKSHLLKKVQIIEENKILFNDGKSIKSHSLTNRQELVELNLPFNLIDFHFRQQYQDFIVLTQDFIICFDERSKILWKEETKTKNQISPLNVFGNEIWYNIDGQGMFFFNEKKRKFQTFKLTQREKGFNSRGLFQDSKNRYWTSSRSEGICQFDKAGNLVKWYCKGLNNSPTNFILNIVELNDGSVLGAGGPDIIIYDEMQNKFEKLNYLSKLKNHFFGSINRTEQGNILLEDWNNPKYIFELRKINNQYFIVDCPIKKNRSYEFYHINTNIGDTIFLAINSTQLGLAKLKNDTLDILNLYNANSSFNNAIVVGSKYYLVFTDGLYIYDNKSLKKVNQEDDLLNQNCYGVLNDDKILYISTNSGLISYNIESKISHQFSLTDGLQDLEYNLTGAVKDNEGNMWFGGINGINKFNPKDIKLLNHKVPINISSLKINGSVKKGIGYLNDIEQLKFNYFDNTLEFNFNGIDYSDPEAVKLKYKLNNYEKNWNELKDNNGFARYPNLPPGHYSLHILAANSEGIWNKEPKIIDINILPPFWMTWWFITLVAFSAIGLLYFIIKSYYKRKLEKQNILLREQALIIQSQQAIEKERNRIASEMHDDLGSGLTRIKYLSDKALQLSGQNEKDDVQKIANYSDDLVKNMSEIIWAMNSRFDNVDNLIAYVRRYASEYLEQNDIELIFATNETGLNPAISGEKRRNVFLVIKEILHNAVKYSGAKAIRIHIEVKDGMTITIIEVGGKGFDVEEMKDKSNGIYNMQKRMEGIGNISFTRKAKGMEIMLTLII